MSTASTAGLTDDKGYDIFVEAFCLFPTSDQTYGLPGSRLSVAVVALTDTFVINLRQTASVYEQSSGNHLRRVHATL